MTTHQLIRHRLDLTVRSENGNAGAVGKRNHGLMTDSMTITERMAILLVGCWDFSLDFFVEV
jgi:hypothetical protein